jgi:ATP-GRASP peptide maturase of grasp-with-spasm system
MWVASIGYPHFQITKFKEMVLIFSTKFDYSTSYVIKWLDNLGIKVIRINGDDSVYKFESIANESIYFTNTITNEVVNLSEASACWWRRTGITIKHLNPIERDCFKTADFDLSNMIKGKHNYLDDEAKALVEYIFYSIYKACKINLGKPLFNLNRLIVLDIAQKCGLQVPSYRVIRNGQQLVDTRIAYGKFVTKAIANGIYKDLYNHRFYTYTELMEDHYIEENKDTIFFPSLVTRLIEKQIEIRSFYIAGDFYSMAIFSQTDAKTKIDFRKYTNNRTEPYKLPKDVETKLRCVFNKLDLNCGSADLIIDDNGDYTFLEINPVGQFGMTSEPCNYDLHKLVAKYLIYGK